MEVPFYATQEARRNKGAVWCCGGAVGWARGWRVVESSWVVGCPAL